MNRLKPIIVKRNSIHATVGVAVVLGMVLMPFLVKPVMANNGEDAVTCDPEVVDDTSGKADYVYKLDTDCTLHIGPTNIPSRYVHFDVVYPIQQHDKVRRIVFDKPEQTSLNWDSSYLFYGYPKAESIEGIDKLDVSHVARFENAFAGLNLKEKADLTSWNVSNAYYFVSMFQGSNLDGFKGIGNFKFNFSDTAHPYTRDFQAMFKDTVSTEGIDLSGWEFLNAHDSQSDLSLGQMFDGAKTPKIDVSNFSDLIITDTVRMFANTNADIEGLDKLSTQNLINASNMFENAKPTDQVDLSSWDTRNLNSAGSMFKGSDIDKFSGLDKWNLSSLINARAMYANLHPSNPVHIQTRLPHLNMGSWMFSGSDIDMFLDIDKLQFSTNSNRHGMMFDGMFENSTATYLNMSKWTTDPGIPIFGMLASPNIKYTTFGNKTVGPDYSNDFIIDSGSEPFYGRSQDPNDPQSVNVWDRTDLPKEYSAKKWATLPIKPECDAKFDGHPDHLSKDCWDDSQSWVSEKTGEEADEELMDNTDKHYQRIFFRVESIPVGFHANGVDKATNMPDMKYFLKTFTSKDDLIPNNIPEDPSGAKVFDSWNTQADGKGKSYHPGDHIGHDITSIDLYAQWRSKAPKIQFDNNGGEGPTPETKPSSDDDTKITVDCTSTPSRNGSTFIGWSKTKNDVLEGSEAGEKGQIAVCGYSGKKTITGIQGKTIDLYATWARKPKAVFKENRPKDMTALLPETKTITGDWTVDDSTPRTYVAPNIDGWYKGYTPDGVYQFDGWTNEDGSPFTGTYLEREDITINAKWSRIKSADVPSHDNEQNHDDNNNQDNKPSDDDPIDDSNSHNNDNNEDKDPSSEKKPSASENRPESDGISSISNINSNQMIDGNSDTGDSPDVGNSEAAVFSNETAVKDTSNEEKGSQLAKTGVSLILPVAIMVSSVAVFIIAKLKGKRKWGIRQDNIGD